MMTPRLLQNGRLPPALEAELATLYDVHPLWAEPDVPAFLARHGREFVGLVTSAAVGADATLIGALPRLRVIASFGVGLDLIDLDAAARRDVAVGFTPDVLNDCVADLAFALLLDVARGVSAADRHVRRGGWLSARWPLTTRVSGKRLGILGLGRIGRAIAWRGAGFDLDVRYSSRRPVEGVSWRFEPSVVELARWADFLVIAAAGGTATRHLVSAEVLDALGPQGFLVNIARGSVVDEAALVDALVAQRIAGAGLDVFENEPNVPPELFGLDNVVLLPHLASGTHETRKAMADLVRDNLHAYFSTGRLLTPAPLH